ncbi:DUF6446 family protein [Pacificibacter sp. AS14]|uniref:DUF6446 family protein n=1 Tax=Pacificibacter sp. AS14 TaxID=3135785 RepID=UPI003173245F
MKGSIVAGGILVTTAIFGIGLYYSQVYAYYDPIEVNSPAAVVFATTFGGASEDILAEDFEGIDANTSPIKYRSCFKTPLSQAMMTETFIPHEAPTPLTAPSWFDCFDAKTLEADIESGAAMAFMGTENIVYGIDRVLAVYADGRAFAWHQINACGATVFEGEPAPEGCPPAPAINAGQ